MTKHLNPALYEEPLKQPMKVVPPIARESLFNWLELTGRFHSSEVDDFQDHKLTEGLDDILEPEVYILENDEEDQQD